MVRVKASQKVFTEEEVARLLNLRLDELHQIARSRHLGILARAAEAAGAHAEQFLFTLSDLMILAVLWPRTQH